MDDKQCEIYRDRVNERLQIQDKRLDDHAGRIKELENHRSAIDVRIERIDNLIKTIEDLIEQTKWLKRCVTGTIIGAIVSAIITLIVKVIMER